MRQVTQEGPGQSPSTVAAKRELRAALRTRRRAVVAARDLAADASALARHVLDLAEDTGARQSAEGEGVPLALSYESLPHEPPTGEVNRALVAAGWRVLVPLTLPDLDLDWCDVTDPERTPLGLDAPSHADLALVPGLAADPFGTRLGQGGGSYDRALARLSPHAPVVLLLHPGERADEPLPAEPHDRSVSAVLTAEGVTPSSARG